MRSWIVAGVGSFLLSMVGCQQNPKLADYAVFGGEVKTAQAMKLADVVPHADRYEGKPVALKAEIAEVCQNRGCWMLLADGPHQVRVRFTASPQCTDGFVVPRNAAGRLAYVQGTLQRETLAEEVARHYAIEAGKPTAEVEKIKGPQPAVSMVATGVMISDKAGLDPT